jgi:hypothetical protein
VIADILNVGPLKKEDGQKFSEMRSAFWNQGVTNEKQQAHVADTEHLMEVSLQLARNGEDEAWVWMAPLAADVCNYLWTIKYLGKYKGRFKVVNIAGLPFLDNDNKLFFPKSIAEVPVKEITKAMKLARPVSDGEQEVDGYEWEKLVNENMGIRTLEGSKKIVSRKENYYDSQLLECCTAQYQKAGKVVHQAMARSFIPTGDTYLGWRLRKMAEAGLIVVQGDATRSLKDFEVKTNEGSLF